MPSSHAASVSALSTAVGMENGFTSLLFGVTLYFSLVVMYDAAGLRRAAGRHAVVLNRLIDEHFKHSERDTHRLMELLGHTPLEVFVGVRWAWLVARLVLVRPMSLLENLRSPATSRRSRAPSSTSSRLRCATSSSRRWRAAPGTWRRTSASSS